MKFFDNSTQNFLFSFTSGFSVSKIFFIFFHRNDLVSNRLNFHCRPTLKIGHQNKLFLYETLVYNKQGNHTKRYTGKKPQWNRFYHEIQWLVYEASRFFPAFYLHFRTTKISSVVQNSLLWMQLHVLLWKRAETAGILETFCRFEATMWSKNTLVVT